MQQAKNAHPDENNAIITVTDKEGRRYYYGNPINRPLLEDRLSVWSLVGGAVQSHREPLPDMMEIVEHVTKTIGGETFGIPRLPENIKIRFPPQECLRAWHPLKNEILDVLPVPANDWPLAYALAIQQLIDQGKAVLPPAKAAVIVMECAVPMSKILIKQT